MASSALRMPPGSRHRVQHLQMGTSPLEVCPWAPPSNKEYNFLRANVERRWGVNFAIYCFEGLEPHMQVHHDCNIKQCSVWFIINTVVD